MIDAYKRFHWKYQIGAITFLTLIAFLIGLQQGLNPFIVAGFTAAALTILHVFLTKLNSLLAFIVLFAQSSIYILIMVSVEPYSMTINRFIPLDSSLIIIMVGSYGLVTVGLYGYVGYKFSRGRLWINLATGFILTNFITGTILLIQPLFYFAAVVLGFITGLSYLALRMPRKKKKQLHNIPTLKSAPRRKAEELFESHNLPYKRISNNETFESHYLLEDERGTILATVVSPESTFSISNTGILCDNQDLVPVLENILSSKKLSGNSSQFVDTVLLVMSSSKNLQPLTTVSISKWKQPDHPLGSVYIFTATGFSRFVRARKDNINPLNKKKQSQVKNFSNKFDTVS